MFHFKIDQTMEQLQLEQSRPRTLTKFLMALQLTIFILLIGCLELSATTRSGITTISLYPDDVSPEQDFAVIQRSVYPFLYNNEPSEEGWSLSYNMVNKTAIIMSEPAGTTKQKQTIQSLPNKKITGQVSDSATGQPISGVTIKVKGQKTGTVTDAQGNFSLEVPDNAVLEVRSLGYSSQEITVAGKTVFKISLATAATGLNQLVVVGYGRSRAGDISGAQSSVSAKSFEQQPVSQIAAALNGKAAGVHVQRTSGEPGAGFTIRVRGSNSINGNNEPLYVVDGLQKGGVGDIDPKDIASMEILKDASATAIYGSRGANGVVLITTKSGQAGKAEINFSGSVGFQSVEKRLDLLNGPQFAKTVNEERLAEGANPAFSDQQIAELEKTGGTDWQDVIFRDAAPVQRYNLSVSGGSKKLDFYISGGIVKNRGTVRDERYKRYSLRANLNYKFSDKLRVGLNISGDRRAWDGNVTNVSTAVRMSPTLPPLKNEDGSYALTSPYAAIEVNPFVTAMTGKRKNIGTNLNTIATVQYDFTDALSLNILGGMVWDNSNNNYYNSIILDNRGHAQAVNSYGVTLQSTERLTYDKFLNQDNHLKVDLIFENQYAQAENATVDVYDFPTDATGYKNLALGNTLTASSAYTLEKLLSYVGRVNYVFKDKYMITAATRIDGSSRFQEGKRFGTFPSVSVGWMLGNENFIKDLNFFDELKLRGSYGLTGSQAVSAQATQAKLIVNNDVNYPINKDGNRALGIAPSNNLANPDLTWETTRQTNIGLDMALFESRFNFTADYYRKLTYDLLLDQPLPDFMGASVITRNLGKVENKGVELSFGYESHVRGDKDKLSFTGNINFTFGSNKVLELGEGRTRILLGPSNGTVAGVNPILVQIGQPLGTFEGYIFEGVYQEKDAAEAAKYGRQPGDARYKDVNNDGSVTGDDVAIIGNSQPDFTYGFNGTVSYKNFDLNLVITGVQGGKIYNLIKGQLFGLGGETLNPVTADILNRWTPDHPSNTVPGFTKTSNTFVTSSQFLEDGSYMKITNLALSYTLPQSMIKKIALTSLKIFASAQNLATFTRYSGYDPQLYSNGSTDYYRGLNYSFSSYPLARTITFGIDITF
jgi:TonB-linked SusC/RagA family outer membrane protein